ncbi:MULTISPECIES: thiol reductant ABC exporter subunit CydC [unclassified Halomonas]|uniref:thiol reductant ABC exporter subunit CydC n=1 Tax=unclassified Halomonas TaxID=2609666 RepID=UPI0007DA2EBD|nr:MULTISPECIES: thiol reductant ABC exporter subunit CydC [unclassified Halomonas]MBT2788731.1 thiol reductant ABC exporter subunit CydC [Halomonas sp. ISL-106]MBT2798322.1 thiol reductant ABC exporter subunit CydC [Halomonas sp. ISL-104]OAL60863.1 thiol reductant ABC exporter subunit CydC [Halomonas sp. ALS9]
MMAIYRDFRPWLLLLMRRRRRFLLGALLVWITLMAGLALLGLSGWFITASALTGIALALGIPARLDVYVPGGGIRFFALARTVARYVERLYNHNTVLTLLADLRYRVFGYLTRFDDARLHGERASDWLSRLTADIDTLDNFYLRLLVPPLVALLSVVAVSLFVAIWLPGVGVLMAVSLSLLWLVATLLAAAWGFSQSYQQVVDQQSLRRLVVDQVQASAELMSYRTTQWHRAMIANQERQAFNNQRRLGRKAALINCLVSVISGLLVVAVVWFASLVFSQQLVPGPILVMAALIALGANEAFITLPASFIKLGASYAAVCRLNELTSDSMSAVPAVALPENVDLSIQANQLSLRYSKTLEPALSCISLQLPAGKRAVITGNSGAGKSSLASLLMGRLKANQGEALVGGVPAWQLTDENRANHFAMLTQQVDLFDASIAENLRIANPAASDGMLWEVLKGVALDGWVEQLPQGLATAVGEKGQQLSGGQGRRLALARLLLCNPQVVILDEPFAGVDAATAKHIAATLDKWLVDRTAIFFVHQVSSLSLLPGVEYHWHLDAGKLEQCPLK